MLHHEIRCNRKIKTCCKSKAWNLIDLKNSPIEPRRFVELKKLCLSANLPTHP